MDSLSSDPTDLSLGGAENDLGAFDESGLTSSLDGLDSIGSDPTLGGDSLGSGLGEDSLAGFPGDETMGGGGDMSDMLGQGIAAPGTVDAEAENPCSCTHHLTECQISEQLALQDEAQRSATMTSMFALACDEPGKCAYLDDPNQLQHCSEFEKLSYVFTQYYIAGGRNPESCNWDGYAQLTEATEPTANCQAMLTDMGLLGGGAADMAMSPASEMPEGLGGDLLGAGDSELGMGGDPFANGADELGMGTDADALGDEFGSLGGDSMLGGGGDELSLDSAGAADSLFGGDLGSDPSSLGAETPDMGAGPSDDLSAMMGDAGLSADTGAAGGSGGGRPELIDSAVKQKRDWRARRA